MDDHQSSRLIAAVAVAVTGFHATVCAVAMAACTGSAASASAIARGFCLHSPRLDPSVFVAEGFFFMCSAAALSVSPPHTS